jgi:hypothetical protein
MSVVSVNFLKFYGLSVTFGRYAQRLTENVDKYPLEKRRKTASPTFMTACPLRAVVN